jgi:hypothetical protein
VLEVTATVWIEDSGNHLRKPTALPFLDLLDAIGEQLLSWFFCDGPVTFLGTSYAKSGLQHIFLADGEGRDIDYLVLEVLKAGFFLPAFGLDRQTEKSGDSKTNLVKISGLPERRFAAFRCTCGNVEVEIFVSPSSKSVTVRFAKSMPKPADMARLHSYQKPVDTAM